ncbi:EGF-like domain-containing protein [Aphelenchoides fujianensis]|nr:EGF-like domain-containing protein [Aphelenchoides fujianensis]
MSRQRLLRAAFPLLFALLLAAGRAHGYFQQQQNARGTPMDIPPPGVSSLTFVFDRTGSMNDDLVQVRHGAKGIFDTVMKQRKKLIYNYVLVLFHDPEVDPPFVTADPDVFQQELATVSVQGGGDCPEMALSGIKKALEVSLPGSYIYVFTDAKAKDYHLEERILNLIQEKHSSVVFVMTGDCGDRTSPGYRVFEKIAAASFGQVFHLEKSHVNTVLEYVRHAVEQRMIHLLYEVRERGQLVVSPVAVDGMMTELTISLSGQRDDSEWLNITLIDPEGDTVDKAVYENQAGTIDLKNVKLIRVKNPQPGMWKVRTTSKNKHTLRIFGISSIDFKYGFSTRVVDSIELAHPRPIANQLTYLMVNMSGLQPPGLLMQVSLLDYHGRILYRNESRSNPRNGDLYFVGPFMPPKGFFFVRVQGEDETGYEFVRISSTAISTVDATGPRAYMADRTMATAFQPVNLTLVSTAGNHTATTYLDSREPPPHIMTVRNYTVILHQPAFLHCRTQSSEEARIVWERNGVVVGNSAKVYQYPNGTLRILDANLRDADFYLCRATTSGGTDEARIFLSVYELPQVVVKPPLLYVAPGREFSLSCVTSGDPPPEPMWFFRGQRIVPDADHYMPVPSELMVRSAREQDLGTYECRASNLAGIAMDAAQVMFAKPPQVQIVENKLMIGRGTQLQLDCRILQGTPQPTIKWFKDNRELYPGRGLQLHDNRLEIPSAQESDAATYVCRAENIAGVHEDKRTIQVGVAPTIVPSPERVQGNIEGQTTLQCRALGVPRPTITWTKDRKPIDVEGGRFSVLPDGSLLVHEIRVEDQGYFTCEVRNDPILAQAPTEANLIEGQDLILNCIVLLGTPKPTIQWLRNGKEVESSDHTEIQSDGSLLLRKGLAEQEGDYECKASSPAGAASLNVNVQLISKPTLIDGAPTVVKARAGEPLDLKCPIRSVGGAKAMWTLEGQPLHGNTASYTVMPDNTLRIHQPDHVHAGQYACSIVTQAGSTEHSVAVEIQTAPLIAAAQSSFNLVQGDTVALACEVDATPPAELRWLFNGAEMEDPTVDETGALVLETVTEQQRGVYSCIAENEIGKDERKILVTVHIAPVIEAAGLTKTRHAIVNQTVRLECPARASPPPQRRWSYEGTPLFARSFDSTRIAELDNDGALVIRQVQLTHAGSYECHVSNLAGEDSATYMLEVQSPPLLLQQLPEETEAIVGIPLALSCRAQGTPTPAVQWERDGVGLAADDARFVQTAAGTLRIAQPRAADSGVFRCIAKNVAGVVSSQTTLSVREPPTVRPTQRSRYQLIEGAAAQVECEVDAHPAPIIEWFLEDRRLEEGEDGVRMLSMLTPPEIRDSAQPESRAVVDGSSLTLNCLVASNQFDSILSIQWFWNGRPLSASGEAAGSQRMPRVTFTDGQRRLAIPRAQAEDAGNFTCVARNAAGSSNKSFLVEINVPPFVDDQQKRQQSAMEGDRYRVIENASLVIPCEAHGVPAPRIEWLRNGAVLTSSEGKIQTVDGGQQLRITSARAEHDGFFVCRATNELGATEIGFGVEVIQRPILTDTTTEEVNVIRGDSFSFNCPLKNVTFTGNITWLFNMKPIPLEGDRYKTLQMGRRLFIAAAVEDDRGTYSCTVRNAAGETRKNYALNVLIPPSISLLERDKRRAVVENGTLELECPASGNPIPTIRWFKNGVLLDAATLKRQLPGGRLVGSALRIENIQQESGTARFTCEAQNVAGVENLDISVEVMTRPKIHGEPNASAPIDGEVGGRAEIECKVSGTPAPTITWLREGTPIPTDDPANQFYATHNQQKLNFVDLKKASRSEVSFDSLEHAGTFTCVAEHDPRVTLVQGGRQLKIERVDFEDSGHFVCIATNAAGSQDLDTNVRVVDKPKIRGEPTEELSTLLNKRHVFHCDVDARSEPFTIEWFKSGQLVGSAKEGVVESEAYIQAPQRTDAAKWTCKVQNPAGDAQKEFEMTILVRPQIDELRSSPTIVNAVHGNEVELNCRVDAIPKAQISWTKEGEELEAGDRFAFRSENETLLIPTATSADDGRFVCRAENSVGSTSRTFVLKLAGPPLLGDVREQPTVQLGESQTLSCEPRGGNPPFQTEWHFDGRPLTADFDPAVVINEDRLLLSGARLNHSGEFRCVVRNEAGESTKTFALVVQQRPRFVDSAAANPTIIAGRSLVLDCTVEGVPRPLVTWRKDGEILPAAAGREFLNNHQQLYVEEATDADAGLYVCQAVNDAGTNSKTIVVTTLEAPTMTQARQDVEAKENETLTLTCPVNNAANVRIEWMQNQQPIVVSPSIQISENGHKLHFINVQKSHRGLISCTAENEAGGSEAIFDVLVQVAPTIQLPAVGQRHVAVMRNHTLALQCQAEGVPAPELTWAFNGVPFAAQHGSSFIPLGNTDAQLELTAGGAAEFRIANVSRKQQGRYSCSAVNKVGRAEATVVVQVIEPLKLRTPSDFVRVIQGQELAVRCEVESGMRPLSAEWQKGNQTFVSLVEESGEQLAFYLHVREAQPADAGTYVCLVKSSAGQAQLPIRVEVLVPPKIEAGERVLKVVEGSQLTLDCRASGAPDPEVTWHFGSRLLSVDNQGHFVIKRANVSQSGVYRCEAKNAAATVSADFHVEVLVKPRIRTYEKVVRSLEGEPTRLECKFEGNPEPTVKWMRSGKAIGEAGDASNVILSPRGESLLIPKTKRADGGDWSCLVSNAAGTAEAPFVVLVNTAPHIDELIDQNPRIIEGNSVLLVCPVLGDPAPTVQWRHDGKPLELKPDGRFKAEGTNLRIENAQAGDSGRLTCAAENDIGGLETDYELEVMAAPRFLSAGQRNFVAIEGQPISIECPAEASPQPTIEWFRGTIQMSSDSTIQISPNAKKLKILNTTLEHAGKLICRATNVAGSTEIELTLRVIVPPRIDESNLITSPLAVLNRSIYLECPVRAIPPPSIHWLKDGKPVEAADLSDPQNAKFSLQQANQTFGIRRVEHSDRGVFTCVVENEGGSVSQDFTVEVLIPPVMEKQEPEEIVKREGDTLMLSCPVKNTLEKSQSTPDLTVSWTQDGRPLEANSESVEISPDGKHLKLKNIRVANAGQFKCVAANRAGQTHAKFNVNVLSIPKIEEEKINDTPNVPIGHATTLWCPVSGHPPPTVRWFKGNGEEVREVAGRVRKLDRGQGLELLQAGLEDVGTWTCRAENDAGVTEKAIKLNVWVEPKVQVRALNDETIVPTGATVTLFCNASGNPRPALSWNFNGQLIIPASENIQISLSSRSLGNYSCVARNELGAAEATIAVDILVPPEINRENVKLNRQLPTGRSITLFCDASGKPPPAITWFHNDKQITDEFDNVVMGTDNKFIQCVVANDAGGDQLQYNITVNLAPSIINSGTTQVIEGDVAVLECIAQGEPKPKITWQRNGIRIETGLRYVVENQILKIIDTHSTESGIYVCVSSNGAPVRIGPNETQLVNATQGQPTIITCGVQIDPNAKSTVVWKRNGEPIQEDDDVKTIVDGRQARLQLADTSLKDESEYECTVVTSVGNASASTHLFVGVPPKISDTQRKVIVKRGERAKIWCETVGVPTPQLRWHRDNFTVPKENLVVDEDDALRLALMFDNIQPENAGVYTCEGSSWVGADSKDFDLVVLIPPIITPERIDINASLSDDYISLPCNATGNPEPVVTWVKVPNMDLIGREDRYVPFGSSLIIRNISAEDDDFYHCIAKSSAGRRSFEFFHSISALGQAIGVRRVTVNNLQLDGPPRVWVECDSDGQPVQNSFLPPRGDSPEAINPKDIEYLPWEDRHLHAERQGPNVVFYKCVPSSRDQRSGSTHVPSDSPPQLIEQPPRTLNIADGDGLKLKCSATGSPPPKIIWTKEDAQIHESFDGVLDLRAADDLPGQYACIARSSAGEQRAAVSVERQSATAAPEQAAPVTVLNCDPSIAANATEIFWEVDGQRIETNVINDQIHVLANGSLVVSYFTDGDELDDFECVAFDAADEERRHKASNEVYMEVLERPPRVDIPQPRRLHAQNGTSIRIDCVLVEGDPLTTRIRWTKNNVNLELDGEKYVVLANNSLVINELNDGDRASYKCRAWNRKGKSYDETGLIIGTLPATIEARIHGKINGKLIQPTQIQFGTGKANILTNDLMLKLRNLPLGANATAATSALAGLMAAPAFQLGYDPQRSADEVDPKTVGVNRQTEYSFASGERMRVEQKSAPVDANANRMVVDVKFDGDLPKIEDENVRIDPIATELTADRADSAVGRAESALHFGDAGRIPFTVDEKFAFENAQKGRVLEPGTTLRLSSESELDTQNGTDDAEMRLKVRADRYGNCPQGYARIKAFCKDIDECAMDAEACAGRRNDHKARCVNKNGGYECHRECDGGFTSDGHGDCVDLNECALGLFRCDNGTDGGCVDVNECLRDPCFAPMECVNFAGGYECVCPVGMELSEDGTKCTGLNGSTSNPLQHLTFDTKPGPVDCPAGLQWAETSCMDIDECAFDAPCQYKCLNKQGGYECICPPGYVINELGQCFDIDECQAKDVCGKGELCFNQLGEYSCIANACPTGYRLQLQGSESADCIPTCRNCSKPVIHIYLIPLPAGLTEGTSLARLAAHDHQGRVLKNTTYHEVHGPDTTGIDDADSALDVATKEGKAIVSLAAQIPPGTKQRLQLRSASVSPDGLHKYSSNFHIFIAISKYPF